MLYFFFQAEDGIRDIGVTGVQTCALPIWLQLVEHARLEDVPEHRPLAEQGHGRVYVLRPPTAPLELAERPVIVEDEVRRSEERRVGKECRSRWSTYH